MARRHAFTLIELLVVLAMILLLVGIIAPALTPVLEIARRQKCAANLNKLVKDMRAYAVSNEQFFPSAFDCDASATVKKVLGSNYVGGRTSQIPAAGKSGPSRSLFLLVRGKYTSNLEVFICPSTDNTAMPIDPATGKPIPDANADYDFVSGQQLSYSYQSNKDGGNGRFWPVSMSSDATLIVLADRSPVAGTVGDDTNSWNSPAFTTWTPAANGGAAHGGWDKYTKNSYNHGVNSAGDGGEGQNVADAAGGVAWKDTPNCGGRVWKDGSTPKGDNIWTWGSADTGVPQSGGDVDASPAHAGDSFLR